MQSTEKWQPIPGYEGYYEASNLGRIRTVIDHPKGRSLSGTVMKLSLHRNGYLNVGLHRDGVRKVVGVHRLVAAAFHGAPSSGMVARHIDGVRTNNKPSNLEWGLHSDNMRDAVRHGTHYSHGRSLDKCKRGHEFNAANTHLSKSRDGVTRRVCRSCRNEAARRRRQGMYSRAVEME